MSGPNLQTQSAARHYRSDDISYKYNCNLEGCGEAFNSVRELNKHVAKESHDPKGSLQDFEEVDLQVIVPNDLEADMNSLRNDTKTVPSGNFAPRLNTFVRVRQYLCEWEGCGKSYYTSGYLNAHMDRCPHGIMRIHEDLQCLTEKTSPGTFVCNWQGCTKSHTSLAKLNTHVAAESHGCRRHIDDFDPDNQLEMVCPELDCNRTFDNTANLDRHVALKSHSKNSLCQENKPDGTRISSARFENRGLEYLEEFNIEVLANQICNTLKAVDGKRKANTGTVSDEEELIPRSRSIRRRLHSAASQIRTGNDGTVDEGLGDALSMTSGRFGQITIADGNDATQSQIIESPPWSPIVGSSIVESKELQSHSSSVLGIRTRSASDSSESTLRQLSPDNTRSHSVPGSHCTDESGSPHLSE